MSPPSWYHLKYVAVLFKCIRHASPDTQLFQGEVNFLAY